MTLAPGHNKGNNGLDDTNPDSGLVPSAHKPVDGAPKASPLEGDLEQTSLTPIHVFVLLRSQRTRTAREIGFGRPRLH
jgi:hypothetical protein